MKTFENIIRVAPRRTAPTPRQPLRLNPSTKARRVNKNGRPRQKHGNETYSTIPESDPFHVDQANKTVTTVSGALPLSPIMDPSFHKIRGQYTVEPKKKRPSEWKDSEFDLKLDRNVYARILSTPARACGATSVVLPSFFHLKFKSVQDPEGPNSWFVPTEVSLKTDGLDYKERRLPGPGMHTLCQQQLLREFLLPNGKHKGAWRAMAAKSTATRHLKGAHKIPVWRGDMDFYILKLLRRHITQCLIRFAGMAETAARNYVVRCNDYQDVKNHFPRGCLLYIGKGRHMTNDEAPPPARLSTMDLEGMDLENARGEKKIPIHDLTILLGTRNIARLRRRKELFRYGSLYLLRGRRSAKLQMQLWRLQGYMMDEQPERKSRAGEPDIQIDDPEAKVDVPPPSSTEKKSFFNWLANIF